MLLIDLSSIVINSVQGAITKEPLSLSMVRHCTLSQILYYKKKYKGYLTKTNKAPILCVDSRHYWRKDMFKFYKQNRKKARKKSKMDWELFFEYFNIVKEELQIYVPYPYIHIAKCEGDDVMYILAMKSQEPVMIVSADKDMAQCQLHGKDIKQYSPKTKKLITLKSLDYNIIEHILRGDSSDGIPNIKSDADVFLCDDKRQKQISTVMVNDATKLDRTELICENKNQLEAFKRNQTLIDMSYIPEQYKKAILDEWKNVQENPPKNRLRKYFIEKRMRLLFNKIKEFN